MKIHRLKLDKRLVPLLKNGLKTHEFRKLNKNHINKGDCILFIDMESEEQFCDLPLFKVIDKEIVDSEGPALEVMLNSVDALTYTFVRKYYAGEEQLLVFRLEKWEGKEHA